MARRERITFSELARAASEFRCDLFRRPEGWCCRHQVEADIGRPSQRGADGFIELLLVFDAGIVEADDDEGPAAGETGSRRGGDVG